MVSFSCAFRISERGEAIREGIEPDSDPKGDINRAKCTGTK